MNEITTIDNDTDVVVVREDLATLARRINSATEAAEDYVRTSVDRAIEAGRLLNQAKGQVEHGQWAGWIADNCRIAPRTAQAYMRLAKRYETLSPADAQRVALLPLRDAVADVRVVATNPKAPPPPPSPLFIKQDKFEAAVATLKAATKKFSGLRKYGLGSINPTAFNAVRKQLNAALQTVDELERGAANKSEEAKNVLTVDQGVAA